MVSRLTGLKWKDAVSDWAFFDSVAKGYFTLKVLKRMDETQAGKLKK